jgi:integrase/recombinase XerD
MANDASLIDEYVQWLAIEKGRSNATLSAYRSDLEKLLLFLRDSGSDFVECSEANLELFLQMLLDEGKAASSIARVTATMRGFFGYLVEETIRTTDPTALIRGTRRGKKLPKPLSEEAMAVLLDSVVGNAPKDARDRAMLEFLYGTGARVSELIGVDLADVNFDESLILLTGKGSKQRLVPMGGHLERALKEYLLTGRSQLVKGAQTTKLFVNQRGSSLSRQGVDGIIHGRTLQSGVDASLVSAHVFRHSCATHMLSHGADIRVVQELLGHASIATTQIYTAVSVGSLQGAYQEAHPRAKG